MIYKPDCVARSMKELLVLLEDQLHAHGINLHILHGLGITGTGSVIAVGSVPNDSAMSVLMRLGLGRTRSLRR